MNGGTILILVILAGIVVAASFSGWKHVKGEGGCCGGSPDKEPRKTLDGKIVARKIVRIEGMHCQNCKNNVERQLNRIDGASALVKLKKHMAVVKMTRMVSDEELKAAVARADFHITDITCEEV